MWTSWLFQVTLLKQFSCLVPSDGSETCGRVSLTRLAELKFSIQTSSSGLLTSIHHAARCHHWSASLCFHANAWNPQLCLSWIMKWEYVYIWRSYCCLLCVFVCAQITVSILPPPPLISWIMEASIIHRHSLSHEIWFSQCVFVFTNIMCGCVCEPLADISSKCTHDQLFITCSERPNGIRNKCRERERGEVYLVIVGLCL